MTYEKKEKDFLISKKIYWCVGCIRFGDIFNPLPAVFFAPEVDRKTVLEAQIKMWESGKKDNYWRNK
jgi:hypothetical protein